MSRRVKAGWGGVLAALTVLCAGRASAYTAEIRVAVVATAAGPPPTTTVQQQLCICMTTPEATAWAAAGSPSFTVVTGADLTIWELDSVADDNCGSFSDGQWTVALAIAPGGCPPAAPSCVPFGPTVVIPNAAFGNEATPVFQAGNPDNGDVPAGTFTYYGPDPMASNASSTSCP